MQLDPSLFHCRGGKGCLTYENDGLGLEILHCVRIGPIPLCCTKVGSYNIMEKLSIGYSLFHLVEHLKNQFTLYVSSVIMHFGVMFLIFLTLY